MMEREKAQKKRIDGITKRLNAVSESTHKVKMDNQRNIMIRQE